MDSDLRRTIYTFRPASTFLLTLVFAINSSVFLSAQDAPPLASPPSEAKRTTRHVKSFELVWNTIRKSHWDADLVGESWDQYRSELLPEIKAARSIKEARSVINKLIAKLGQSHFAIIPASSYDIVEQKAGGEGDLGLTIRLVNGQLMVTAVRSGSAAAKSGVLTGWSVGKLRDQTSTTLLEKFRAAAEGPQRTETIAALAMQRLTSGKPGGTINIEFLDHSNQTISSRLTFQTSPGKPAKLGHLPPIRVVNETKTLSGNVGYFRFSAFLDPFQVMPAYRKAVRNPNHSNGLVIDLRGNIGGLAGMTMGMAGDFVSRPTKLGTMTTRSEKLKFVANPHPVPYAAPVAVLVDEASISSAEILAGGLQDLGLAKVFGRRTAGLALPSVVIKLPNADGFQYAIADYHSASGRSLESAGVEPDVPVNLSREALMSGQDPDLEAALNWINSQGSQ